MPKWIWWVLIGIVALMIWRGQGATLGHDIGKVIHNIFAALTSI